VQFEPQRLMSETLVAAGFADLDPRQAFAFHEIASTLRLRPLDGFGDLNECIGTKNGLGSGWVRRQVVYLRDRGYVTVSQDWAVKLTEKGAGAALCLGIDPRPRT
jgi:hypothetical protein